MSIPQYIPTTSHAEMYVELENMPGKRKSYFPQVMLGVRLEGTGGRDNVSRVFVVVVVVFSAYMTVKSTTLSEVRQNSSLHLVNRNTRGEGGTQIHKKQQQDNQEGVSTRTPCASGLGQSSLILRTMTFHCRQLCAGSEKIVKIRCL